MLVSLVDDLVTYLDNIPELGFTAGTNLFAGLLPQEVSNAVAVIAAPGGAPEEVIDTESQIVDFWCLYDHTDSGYDMAQHIANLLHRKANYSLDNWYIYSSLQSANIIDSDRTPEGSKLFKLSILFTCRKLADIS